MVQEWCLVRLFQLYFRTLPVLPLLPMLKLQWVLWAVIILMDYNGFSPLCLEKKSDTPLKMISLSSCCLISRVGYIPKNIRGFLSWQSIKELWHSLMHKHTRNFFFAAFDQFLTYISAKEGKLKTKWTENSDGSVLRESLETEPVLLTMLGFSSVDRSITLALSIFSQLKASHTLNVFAFYTSGTSLLNSPPPNWLSTGLFEKQGRSLGLSNQFYKGSENPPSLTSILLPYPSPVQLANHTPPPS